MSLTKYSNLFFRNGFVHIPNFFTTSEAKRIKYYADSLEEWKEEKGKWMIYFEKDKNKNMKKSRIENFIHYEPKFKDFLHSRIIPSLNEVNKSNMVLFKDKMNWKSPGGKGFNAHQDQPAWDDFPPKKFVSVALFGNKSSIENGCLEFVKNKHLEGLFEYEKENLGELTEEIENSLKWEPIETTPRDILFFDSFAPHRSGPNNSKKARRIFYFTFNDITEGEHYDNYIIKKREIFPPDIEREGKEIKFKGTKYNLANPLE